MADHSSSSSDDRSESTGDSDLYAKRSHRHGHVEESSDEESDAGSDAGDNRKMPAPLAARYESSDEDDEVQSESSDVEEMNGSKRAKKEDEEEEEEESDESSDESDDDLPLHERVRKKEEKGVSLKKVRSRRSKALEVASKRLKKFQQKEKGSPFENDDGGDSGKLKAKKRSKHAPAEASSKRSDFYRRGMRPLNEGGLGVDIGAHCYKPHDPRISSLSGHFDEEQFEKRYGFLQEARSKEIEELRKRIAARKSTGKKGQRQRHHLKITGGSLEEDEEKLKSYLLEQSSIERRKIERAAKRQVKKKIQEDVESGKSGAYYLKRKEKKRLELEARFELLRKRGGDQAVEKALTKKRRKNKSRDASMFSKQT